jgi:Uma2 family endonuclease
MRTTTLREIYYPESDGKPMAETPLHMLVMWTTIQTLIDWYADDPNVYVWGNMFLYYVKGDIKKCVSPDVFVAKVDDKHKYRPTFKTWEEKSKPRLVVEVTSKKTKKEDLDEKFVKYRDELKVPEYFLFDPTGDYLKKQRLRGYRLRNGEYVPIKAVDGRLPSKVLGLHLEAVGEELRLWNPVTKAYLPTPEEKLAQLDAARRRAESLHEREKVENEKLRREIEELKQQAKQKP